MNRKEAEARHEKIAIEMRGRGFLHAKGLGWTHPEKGIEVLCGSGTSRPWEALIRACGPVANVHGAVRKFSTPMHAADAALAVLAERSAKDDR